MKKTARRFILGLALTASILNCYSLSPSSIQVNTEALLAPPVAGNQRYPVSSYANGAHLVVWQEGDENWGGDSQIRGLIVGDDGTYGGSFLISNAGDVQERPVIATNGTTFLVVWQDLRNGQDYDVYGARVTSSGQVLDTGGIPIATGAGNQCLPAVAFDGTNFVVTWMDNRVVPQSYHLRAARISQSGSLLDAGGVYLAGPIDATALNQLLTSGNLMDVPMFSLPTISCGSQKCIAAFMAKDSPALANHQQPRFAHVNTDPGIVLAGAITTLPSDAVYNTEASPLGPTSSNGTLSIAGNSNNKHVLINAGAMGHMSRNYFVAALTFDANNQNPPITLTIRKASLGSYLGKSVTVPNGDNFLVIWADTNVDMSNPMQYSIKGAIVDGSNNVSTFAVFDLSNTYRGFPHVSIGNSRGLLVYEKDAGAAGIQLAGILFDKNSLPWNSAPSPAFDFSVTNSGDKSISQGTSLANTITTTLLSGTAQPVSFSVGGLPQQLSATFSSNACTPTCTSTLTVSALSTTALGTYPLTVNVTSGALSHSTSFSVTVTASATPPPTSGAPAAPKNVHLVFGQPGTLSVPLVIQEALPTGVAGMTRVSEPVTVGVPIASDSGITTASKLGISGANLAQFRILARWPNGNIKWVLVDTQASVTAGGMAQVTLTNTGSGNLGGSNLAQDNGDTITVSTGAALFVVRKTHFNVFDSVSVGGQALVVSGNAGGVRARDMSNVVYSSLYDDTSTALLEENGPARSVVKATGSLKNQSGARLLDYTLRLHFYKSKSYVRALVTIRNASIQYPVHQAFSGFEAVVPLSLGSGKIAEYSLAAAIKSVPLAQDDTSYLMQGYSDASCVWGATEYQPWDPPLTGSLSSSYVFTPSESVGLDIRNNATVINAMGNMADWSQGYAGVKDSNGGGVALALRWLSSNWPAGFEIKGNGETSIELFSKHNACKTLKLNFGRHEGRELLWDFHGNSKSNQNALYELQYPLIGRAPLAYYQSTGGVFGQRELATQDQQYQFFPDMHQSWSSSSPSLSNPQMKITYRWWPWGTGGGGNQTDFPLNDLLDYIRTGNAGFYLLGEQRTLFNVDTAVPYSDDYSMETVENIKDNLPGYAGINGPSIDMEHAHVLSMPFYYYLTGNEGVKEGFKEYGEYLERSIGSYFPYNSVYLRAWARKYRNIGLLYLFSCETGNCNAAFKSYLEQATAFMLDSRDNPSMGTSSPIGRNLERGYAYWDSTVGNVYGRVVHSLFHPQIHFEAVHQVLSIMNELAWDYLRKQEIEDYMLGLAHFYFDEYLDKDPNPQNPEQGLAFLYDYPLDTYITPHPLIPYDASRAGVFLYQHTGDATYLNKAGILTLGITNYATNRSPSELQDQALIYTYYNLDKTAVWKPLALNATATGGGSYTLSWTAPAGAKKYQIKYSDRPIVEWLGFDKVSRTFKYNPGQYTAFFAAQNLSGQVLPGLSGSQQTFTVTLDPGKQWYFAAKYLSDKP